MKQTDSCQRFSDRAHVYKKHRPGYPSVIIDLLKSRNIINNNSVVADVGAGTGLFTRLFIHSCQTIFGFEPNAAMIKRAKEDFKNIDSLYWIEATSENIPLRDQSLNLITVAQAFHWFDRTKTKKEFKRILKKDGFVLLVWNYRDIDNDALQKEYEKVLTENIHNYKNLDSKTITFDNIADFYGTKRVELLTYPNQQILDFNALKGRIFSSSYIPKPPNPIYNRIVEKVEEIFFKYEKNNKIDFRYITQVYLGQLL